MLDEPGLGSDCSLRAGGYYDDAASAVEGQSHIPRAAAAQPEKFQAAGGLAVAIHCHSLVLLSVSRGTLTLRFYLVQLPLTQIEEGSSASGIRAFGEHATSFARQHGPRPHKLGVSGLTTIMMRIALDRFAQIWVKFQGC
ncbi:MAG TPA: hypothetical protein VFK81_19505 [Terriglobales bacterium]|jgi:hypothetical protein|nr:hypothetical protein [Terriglobales bacterium]